MKENLLRTQKNQHNLKKRKEHKKTMREETDQQSPSIPSTAPSCEQNSEVLPIFANWSLMSSAQRLSLDLALSIFWAQNACRWNAKANYKHSIRKIATPEYKQKLANAKYKWLKDKFLCQNWLRKRRTSRRTAVIQ